MAKFKLGICTRLLTQPKYLLFRVSPPSSLHLRLVLVIAFQIDWQRFRQRQEIDAVLIKRLKSFGGGRVGPVDAEDLDAMAAGRYVEVPIPGHVYQHSNRYVGYKAEGRKYHADRTKVGWVFRALSQHLTTNSNQPSASIGRSILHSLHA